MLPPAGEPCYIGTDPAATERLLQQWRPYQAGFYASGTAALAAAVSAALAVRPGRRRVLLPGYGCPALVSAVLHAGCRGGREFPRHSGAVARVGCGSRGRRRAAD